MVHIHICGCEGIPYFCGRFFGSNSCSIDSWCVWQDVGVSVDRIDCCKMCLRSYDKQSHLKSKHGI